MMKAVTCLLLTVLLAACAASKLEPLARTSREVAPAEKHSIAFENEAIRTYLVRLPKGYSAGATYPLLLAFHDGIGSSETTYRRWAESSKGFILVCPQGTARMGWQIGVGQLPAILACLDDVQKRFQVDPNRIYATGHSMGGHVSWNLATFHAARFAAVAPTASAPMFSDENDLDRLLSVPLYVVHGRNDGIVDLAKNQRAEEYVNAQGGSLTLAIIEGAGHGFVTEQQEEIIAFFEAHR